MNRQHGTKARIRIIKRIALLAVCLALALQIVLLPSALGEGAGTKTVRVGWYESTYCFRDQFGRRDGIAYEYQRKIAAHTGWTYEYVEDSWPNLLQMLINGEIDLLSDVSYTEERTQYMLFSSLAMGAESYYIYIDADNTEITAEDLHSFDGKKIGVNKGSFQAGLLDTWIQKNGLSPEIVELTDEEAYSMEMLTKGDIDAVVSMDSFGAYDRVIPVTKIGASDYYIAVNKDRPDLLNELNYAMSAIQDEDPYINQRLFDEYIQLTRTNAFLTHNLESWLKNHGAIRVGYLNNYLPFCASDGLTGKLTGALKNYLLHASNCLKNADIQFEPVPYPTVDSALEAMRLGEIDCVFPVNMSTYDGEMAGILTVNPIMKTEMSILVKADSSTGYSLKKDMTVAIDEGNTNFETFIKDEIPNWSINTYASLEDCIWAVVAKKADGVLACNYRMYFYEPMRVQYKLAALPTGETMGLSFAVSMDHPELYSILNKIVNLSSSEDMEYALVSYMYSYQKVSVSDFLKDNMIGVLLFITAIFALIVFLMQKRLIAERKLNEQQKQMEDALRRELEQKEQLESVTKMAYRDPLTGVKSKHAFVETEERMDQRIENGELSAFSVVLFDLNDLKRINDTQGHEVGDKYIKEACKIICSRFKHSPVFRIGGDEFVAILEGEDYDNRGELLGAFESQMEANMRQGQISVASGWSSFDPDQDKNMHAVLERADANMYKKKKMMKQYNA